MKYFIAAYIHHPEEFVHFFLQVFDNILYDGKNKITLICGDSDTIDCIVRGIAQAFYKRIPPAILSNIRKRVPEEFKIIIDSFNITLEIKTTDLTDSIPWINGDRLSLTLNCLSNQQLNLQKTVRLRVFHVYP